MSGRRGGRWRWLRGGGFVRRGPDHAWGRRNPLDSAGPGCGPPCLAGAAGTSLRSSQLIHISPARAFRAHCPGPCSPFIPDRSISEAGVSELVGETCKYRRWFWPLALESSGLGQKAEV